MPILSEPVQTHLESFLGSEDPILREMEEEARPRRFPIIGPQCGRVLHMIARMIGARRIFEMGSGFGYSTLWFAKALPDDGEIHHTDGSQANSDKAREYLTRAGQAGKVRFHVGDASAALQGTEGLFDVILLDVDKEQYPACHGPAVERLRPGGVMITDNVLWQGRVADPSVQDSTTQAIREFTKLQFGDKRLFSVLIPLRDGLLVSQRV